MNEIKKKSVLEAATLSLKHDYSEKILYKFYFDKY